MQKEQIEEIEKTGKATDHLTIYAPIGGIVIARHANAGDYVETGTKIYTIADLSEVWVKLDAYESDMTWIRYGQDVEFTTEAYPGEAFKGKIIFIDPTLNPMTRTVKLRVNVANPDGRLKPEMFVRAVVRSKVAAPAKAPTMEDMTKKTTTAAKEAEKTAATAAEDVKKTATAAAADANKVVTAAAAEIEQTMCPIMDGNKIDKNVFVEYKGKKVYFCCADCKAKFEADPEKYIAKLPQFKQ